MSKLTKGVLIGTGGTALVWLATHKKSGQKLALKQLFKTNVAKFGTLGTQLAYREQEAYNAFASPFIVRCFGCFQDNLCLCARAMALHGLLLMLLPPRAATRRRYQVLELCVCDLRRQRRGERAAALRSGRAPDVERRAEGRPCDAARATTNGAPLGLRLQLTLPQSRGERSGKAAERGEAVARLSGGEEGRRWRERGRSERRGGLRAAPRKRGEQRRRGRHCDHHGLRGRLGLRRLGGLSVAQRVLVEVEHGGDEASEARGERREQSHAAREVVSLSARVERPPTTEVK